MPTVPTRAPQHFYQGDTVQWYVSPSDSDITPDNGYALSIKFSGASYGTSKAAADNGDGRWLFTLTAAESAAFTADEQYAWQATASLAGANYTVGTGTIDCRKVLGTSYDPRSFAKKTLDAIESLIEGKPNADVASYTLPNGVSLSKASYAELLDARDRLRAEVLREERKEKIAQGFASSRILKARF